MTNTTTNVLVINGISLQKQNKNRKYITLSNIAAAPPITSNGDSAICAFFTAVTVLVKPGQQNFICKNNLLKSTTTIAFYLIGKPNQVAEGLVI